MRKRKSVPVALTIAGSDSGGGAGIQADLKTFAALGVHGTSVITAITAQNPWRVFSIESCSAHIIRAQLRAVAELHPAAIKTGMLFGVEAIREVVRFVRTTSVPVIVDPVMIATSGGRLINADAVDLLKRKLLPLATLVTPNVPEAEQLTGLRIRQPDDLRTAARALHETFGCAAFVKGGHLPGRTAADVFCDGCCELLLETPRVRGVRTHGTGCTFAAAATALLARGTDLHDAAAGAKEYVANAIHSAVRAGGFDVLNHGAFLR